MDRLKPKTERTKNILEQIGMSSIYKVLSIAITFFLVPLSISYLGSEKYGLWLTVFSFIGWFSFFDFGIGNGLRNKLTIALSSNDIKLAKTYVSTAYFSMMVIMSLLIVIFIFPFYMIPWNSVFNYDGKESLGQLISIVYVLFSINLVLNILTAIYYADQKSSMPGLINFIGQLLVFITVYILMKLDESSLVLYGSIVIGSQVIVFILASFVAFFGKYSYLRPSLKHYNKIYLKELLSLGGKFFFLQILYVLVYSTDNFIINYFLGAEQVTIFNIAFKYFMFVTMGISIILQPYWSAFTSATAKNDDIWIKNSIKNLLRIAIFACVLIICMVFVSDTFYFLWIGDIEVPFLLTILVAINTVITIFTQLLSMYLNGTGKVTIQMYNGVFAATVNIPLSIFLAVNLDMGVSGVVLATILVKISGLIIYPLQVFRLLNKSATGIWNK